ncbi:CoB--CoM heterodisulfide reductase iron-sulfur subunit A family protein [Syntrophorhabdus aromaticivorans]|uniref:CoB--CoM heterodisulfide reductase iron-sulfur subunit A family protein n=1 Tax=Syntrophorhabdus aromaticivorans TaxID=328301 RepID=A0A351TZS3_9BACT|nr:CoB--CoM heterodisulfide reductase iron-sulfur subunit A family protein [Syntrophorhabdus aromaticivorans]NLW34981.1 CoB--CoM heterodisulfide reductase iron-sulfur subunit A family protein [Syntrophorhabdus aromaticivorans]HBA53204.1 CoB--CoM heterodisulfide reductase iron-sulfur subunit A family protein [Syntrophorhabdus aromaticivorans]
MKIGIFLCHCGHNIKHTVDVARVKEYFQKFLNVAVAEDYPFLCSEPGQELIRSRTEAEGLDRVIIAACAPTLHQDMFKDLVRKGGLNPFLLRRVSVREHCSWVGDDIEKNTDKAIRLIKAGVYGSSHYAPLEEKQVDVTQSAMVIGGGVSGLSAALFLSNQGMHVYLVEKEAELGGHVKKLRNVWPVGKDGTELVDQMAGRLQDRDNVEIFTSSRMTSFGGSFGNYEAILETPQGETTVKAGGVIVAIGFSPFDPAVKPELGYGKDKRVVTTLELENGLDELGLPANPRVAVLHCVGSRDEQIGKPYCSRVCCINALRAGRAVKEKFKDSYVESFYMDVRAHPKGGEEFYEETQEKGVLFTRGNVGEIIPAPTGVVVRGEDTLFGELFEREFDLAVLSIGMSPPKDNRHIASLLKISLDKDKFFLEAHPKLRPYDTALKGIFIAGTCSGPKDIEESISHGRASAVKLFGLLNLGYAFVEPFVAMVDPKRCSGCRACEQACVAKAIMFDDRERIVRVEEAACMGCGLCNSTCPSSAISLKGYVDSSLNDEIGAILEAI